MPSACKFYPSCSHYAAEAVRLHGARTGSWLALRRVLRCHPFSRGGVDLVPDAVDSSRAEKTAPVVMLSEAKHLSSSNAEGQGDSSARSRKAPRNEKESSIGVTSEVRATEVRS